jgi:hypothetical protein
VAKVKVKKPVKIVKPVQGVMFPNPPRVYEEYTPQWPQEPPQTTNSGRPGSVVIVEPDPLAGAAGMIYVLAAQRMLAFTHRFPQEVNPENFVRMVLARVAAKDPTIKLLVAMNADTGDVLGHSLTMIEGLGTDRWAFCYQLQVDIPGTDIVQRMIDHATPWGKQHGAKYLLMATELDPEMFARKYDFEMVRYVMRREI